MIGSTRWRSELKARRTEQSKDDMKEIFSYCPENKLHAVK
jgi:hypothetical protein